MPHIVASVCSPYVITITPYFISSPQCAHLSPSTCKLLLMFLNVILRCPSAYCIPHAMIKCQMTILISHFPCLLARFLPREALCLLDSSVVTTICLSSNLKYPYPPECRLSHLLILLESMRLRFDQEGCCPRCNQSFQQAY